jgi:1-Cys peroxiredoxin 6
MGGLKLGDTFPDFTADSSEGEIQWHKYIDGSWAILFSHPADYTPVCTTELGAVAKFLPEFAKRGVKVAAISHNDVESHKGWIQDIEAYTPGAKVGYPIIADPEKDLATKLGSLDPDEKDAKGLPANARAVWVIGPDKKLKLSILYPATTGRNFEEVLRVIDSLQLTANHSVATPVNWKHGEKVIIVPSLSDEAAKEKFPKGFETFDVPSGKKYIRTTPQPNI